MRILHYFLGFHRQGGLNRYAADLAATQAAAGNEVFVLYPTGNIFPQKKTKIHGKGKVRGVQCFSLTGGRCVPLLEGIRDPQMLLSTERVLSRQAISDFLKTIRPDILHIHTWMGFPEELLSAVKSNGTKIVYTTHDYFGLCPTVNRLNTDGEVCQRASDQSCFKCNCHAPTERYLELRNSEILIRLKSLLLPLKRVLHRHAETARVSEDADIVSVKPYERLREHYLKLFRQCDKLHFNSPVTQTVFTKVLPDVPCAVLPITHGDIADRRRGNVTVHQPLRLAFFGSAKPYKGLPLLLKVLDLLSKEGVTFWQLDIYGCEGESCKAIRYHGFYEGEAEWTILFNTDLLIVPSIWDETFGFVVEEALCAGVPVLCSDKVGAKILVDSQWIFSGEEELAQKLKVLLGNPDMILQEKRKLREQKKFTIMSEHVQAISDFYINI